MERLLESHTAWSEEAEKDGSDFRGEVEHEKQVVHKLKLKERKYMQAFRKWANEDAEAQDEVRNWKSKVANELATKGRWKGKGKKGSAGSGKENKVPSSAGTMASLDTMAVIAERCGG